MKRNDELSQLKIALLFAKGKTQEVTAQMASYIRDLEQAQKEIRMLKERFAAVSAAAEAISHGAALIEALR